MKVIFLALAIICSAFAYSQPSIGHTEAQIREEFSGISFDVRFTDANRRYIVCETIGAKNFFYFNKNGKCDECYFRPRFQKGMDNYIAEYNRNHTKISDTEWMLNLKGQGFVRCQLVSIVDELMFRYLPAFTK